MWGTQFCENAGAPGIAKWDWISRVDVCWGYEFVWAAATGATIGATIGFGGDWVCAGWVHVLGADG
jgi:hypothetical protein